MKIRFHLRTIPSYAVILLFVFSSTSAQGQTSAVEYFFDHDPGPGNAIPLATDELTGPVSIDTSIPTVGLRAGFHKLFVRTKHTGRHWSLFEPQTFLIQPEVHTAEYFFDHDPGLGAGIPLNITNPGGPVSVITEQVQTSALRQGYHTLCVRTLNTAGDWSLYEQKRFHISVDIVRVEYFIDTDPGIGNGQALAVSNPDNLIQINPMINVGALSEGIHTLSVRTQNRLGVWSHNEPVTFSVESPLPVELLSFEAKVIDSQKVYLKWTTATEKNNSSFSVQHSINGTAFVEIAKLPGAGTTSTENNYSFTHQHPLNGLNYYRLKQTDFDGNFTYSEVKAATVALERLPLVYPIPSSGDWFVDLSRMENSKRYFLEVKDITGRKQFEQSVDGGQVVRFARHEFASGNYFVIVRSEHDILLMQKMVIF